jgi:hypothetical protein
MLVLHAGSARGGGVKAALALGVNGVGEKDRWRKLATLPP